MSNANFGLRPTFATAFVQIPTIYDSNKLKHNQTHRFGVFSMVAGAPRLGTWHVPCSCRINVFAPCLSDSRAVALRRIDVAPASSTRLEMPQSPCSTHFRARNDAPDTYARLLEVQQGVSFADLAHPTRQKRPQGL